MRQPISVIVCLGLLGAVQELPAQDLHRRLATVEQQLSVVSRALETAEKARLEQQARIGELAARVEAERRGREAAQARLRELEGRLDAGPADELEALVEQTIAKLNAAPTAAKPSAVVLGGYFDLEFRDDHAGDTRTAFDQHRLVLSVNADMTSFLFFRAEVEIEGGGFGASFLTDNEVILEQAEIHFRLLEALNLKAGALLVPFNHFNQVHDSPLQDLTDRPLVDRRIVPTTWSEAGVGLYGTFYPLDWLAVDYNVILANGLTDAISATGGTRGARGSLREDNNDNKMVIGRLGVNVDVPILDSFHAGFSLAHGKYDDEDRHNLTMFGFDLRLRKGPFELLGEYAKLNISRGTEEILEGIPGGMEGWYLELRYHFFPESWRGAADFLTQQSTFTLVARYGHADTDEGGTAVDFPTRGDRYRDDRRRLTFGFNFRPVEKTVIKFEYQWFLEPSGIDDVDNNRFVASMATYF